MRLCVSSPSINCCWSSEQPNFLPDKYESGTLNAVGLAGLNAAVRWVLARGVRAIRTHEQALCQQLIDGLRDIPGVTVYGTLAAADQTPTVSFNVADHTPSEVGLWLDEAHGILCRVGLHCAPAAHRTIGTLPGGTVRSALGIFNTADDVARTIAAVRQIAERPI